MCILKLYRCPNLEKEPGKPTYVMNESPPRTHMTSNLNRSLKGQVADYWNDNPCESFASTELPGERAFYQQVERFRYTNQPYMEKLVGFNRFENKRILEVGCGLGTDLRQFALGGADVVGLDMSSNSVALAQKGFAVFGIEGRFVNADSERLPFDDSVFDVVYSFGVLHHTPDTQSAIDECWRVLKPGGQFIIMLYNRQSWHVLVEPYLLLIKRWLSRRALPSDATDQSESIRRYDGDDNPLGKAYSPSEVRNMLRKFADIRTTTRQSRFAGQSPIVKSYIRLLEMTGITRKWGFWIITHATRPEIR